MTTVLVVLQCKGSGKSGDRKGFSSRMYEMKNGVYEFVSYMPFRKFSGRELLAFGRNLINPICHASSTLFPAFSEINCYRSSYRLSDTRALNLMECGGKHVKDESETILTFIR